MKKTISPSEINFGAIIRRAHDTVTALNTPESLRCRCVIRPVTAHEIQIVVSDVGLTPDAIAQAIKDELSRGR